MSEQNLEAASVSPAPEMTDMDESVVLPESSSLDETSSSADFDLQNELFSKTWRADSVASSVDDSLTSIERTNIMLSPKPTPQQHLPQTPSKNIEKGVILKQLVFKGITNQINMAQSKLKSKEATCLTVSSWIAVGTKNGLVLVFDVTQNLKWYLDTLDVLGTKNLGDENQGADNWSNAISALALNCDHSRLLVGNARGNILEYDMKDGKLLRTLNDVHPPDAGILHLKFTDLPTLALLCDSGGSVFELGFKRTLGLRGVDTRCLFSGSRGEVCALEPLRSAGMDSNIVHGLHSKWESSIIVAMATLSKVLIVQIRPTTKVITTQALRGDGESPPCLSWHFVLLGRPDRSKGIEPVLAVGRHRELHFFQLSASDTDHRGRIRSHPLLRFQLDFDLRGLEWLDGRMLALMDSERQVHVVDIKSRETVDTVDVASLDLVTSAPFFQGRATGGNVSEALDLVGTNACYNSMASCAGQLLLLCSTSLRSIALRHWDERLEVLSSQLHRKEDALRLGLRMLEGRAKAMHGLKGNPNQRKAAIKHKVISILDDYIESVLVPLMEPSGQQSAERLKTVLELCIHLYIQLEENSLLFDHLYSTVSQSHSARSLFLDLLEPHLLNDRLRSIPPSIMQHWVQHYEETGRLDMLEQCVTRVEVSCLDLHQILTLAQNAGLYSAFLYVHTQALLDYVSPLEDLMKQLTTAVQQGPPYSEQDLKLGHTILVYISCCLAGQSFPAGGLIEPDEARLKVKHQILSSLTCLHSKLASDEEPAYPFLRLLLEFNTQELLNALSLAFEEAEFTRGEMGVRRQQRVVDILVEIMVRPSSNFSPDQICSLFTFIARQIGRSTTVNTIHLDRELFQRLLDLVCTQSAAAYSDDVGLSQQSRFEERQQALLQLLQAKSGQMNSQDEDKLLSQARSAKFFRVCEFIYEQRKDWVSVLDCYAEDPGRHTEILLLIRDLSDAKEAEKALLKHVQLIARIDPGALALYLAVNKPYLMEPVVEGLERSSLDEYRFVEAVVELANHEEVMKSTEEEDGLWVSRYASLMAQLEPERLPTYVQSVDSQHLPLVLEVCRQFSLIEAEAALLERQGETAAAYDLLLDRLKGSISQLFERRDVWNQFQVASQSVFDFCQRQAGRMTEPERERVWLTLLDQLLSPQRAAKSQPDAEAILSGLREATQRVVTGLQGQVDLTKVLARLIEDPETTGGTLGDLRQLLMGLLDNYTYDTTLLRVSTRLLQGDVHGLMAQRLRQSRKGVSLRVDRCALCQHPLNRTLVSFQLCHHAFHLDCLPPSHSDDERKCVLCHPVAITASPSTAGEQITNRNQQENPTAPKIILSPVQIESVAIARKRLSSQSTLLVDESF